MIAPVEKPALSLDRVAMIDALRGFALFTIATVHFMEQYLGDMPPPEHSGYTRHGTLDVVLEVLFFVLVRGKGFALFSFMFGLSFSLQMERAARRSPGADFRLRFAWRLVVLLGIGYLHSLVYRGDILMVYAALGLPLILFYRVSNRWLWILAMLLLLGTPRLVMSLTHVPPTAPEAQHNQAQSEDRARMYWKALEGGSIAEIAAKNGTQGLVSRAVFQFGPFSRGYQTFALFLIGLWAGRRRLLEDPAGNAAFWARLLRWCGWLTLAIPLIAGALFAAGKALGVGSGGGEAQSADMLSLPAVIGLGVYDLWNFVMMGFYVALFVRLFQNPGWRRRLLHFVPVGQMALSCYVLQSVLGSFLFYGVGVGLLGKVGNAVALLVGIAAFGAQMALCRWWLERFRFGPLEWVWRSLTFLAWQPWRRSRTP